MISKSLLRYYNENCEIDEEKRKEITKTTISRDVITNSKNNLINLLKDSNQNKGIDYQLLIYCRYYCFINQLVLLLLLLILLL